MGLFHSALTIGYSIPLYARSSTFIDRHPTWLIMGAKLLPPIGNRGYLHYNQESCRLIKLASILWD